jgi:hypothetical protein
MYEYLGEATGWHEMLGETWQKPTWLRDPLQQEPVFDSGLAQLLQRWATRTVITGNLVMKFQRVPGKVFVLEALRDGYRLLRREEGLGFPVMADWALEGDLEDMQEQLVRRVCPPEPVPAIQVNF